MISPVSGASVCLPASAFFHSVWRPQRSSTLPQVPPFPYFLYVGECLSTRTEAPHPTVLSRALLSSHPGCCPPSALGSDSCHLAECPPGPACSRCQDFLLRLNETHCDGHGVRPRTHHGHLRCPLFFLPGCSWVDSGSWWWTERPGVLQFMGLQRVRHDWATELNWVEFDKSRAFLGMSYLWIVPCDPLWYATCLRTELPFRERSLQSPLGKQVWAKGPRLPWWKGRLPPAGQGIWDDRSAWDWIYK